MSALLHFVDNQNIFLRFRGVPGKIICFISWYRLKIIVVGRYTTSPDCRFTDSFTYILDPPKIWIKMIRSSRQEVSCKKDGLRNFARFTGKHLCQALFSLLKKRLWHGFFPINFTKFLRTPFLTEHLQWLLLNNYSFFHFFYL